MSDDDIQSTLDQVRDLIADGSPYAASLGMKITCLEPGVADAHIPYSADLVGDPDTGVLHGGAASALLDHAAGAAAFSALGAKAMPATLDLRIEYYRAAEPGETLYASARCRRVTRRIAFVEAIAHDGDPSDPVASCSTAMMIPRANVEQARRVGSNAPDEP